MSNLTGINYLVVPESLAADESGRPNGQPSFVYRQVLVYVLKAAGPNDRVYLAPANAFGGQIPEEQAAYDFLTRSRPSFEILCPGITLGPIRDRPDYVDTWNNGILLRDLVDTKESQYELVTTRQHARRACWCFTRVGFNLVRVHAIQVAVEPEPVVRRTFYYRYPSLYGLYETVAYWRDRLKYVGR